MPIDNNANFHLKPLSHHLWFGITHGGTVLQQKANVNRWHGKVLTVFAKGLVASGYLLNSIVAEIELLVVGIFVGLSLLAYAMTKCRSDFLQKICYKSIAFWHNSSNIFVFQIDCLRYRFFSNKHTLNAYLNHYMHVDAAWGASITNRLPQRFRWEHLNLEQENKKPFALLMDSSQRFYWDMLFAAQGDLFIDRWNNNNNFDFLAYLRNHGLLEEAQQSPFSMNRWERILQGYLVEKIHQNLQVDRRAILELLKIDPRVNDNINTDEEDPFLQPAIRPQPDPIIEIDPPEDDRALQSFANYQNKLKDIVQNSFLELYHQPELVRKLSEEKEPEAAIEDGRDRLINFLALPQLTNYIQLKELQGEIECPEEMPERRLNALNRYQMLKDAKGWLNELQPQEHEILLNKLLLLGTFDLHAQGLTKDRIDHIQKLFNRIGVLTGHLYRSPLLIRNEFGEDGNLFHEACQNAINEVAPIRQ